MKLKEMTLTGLLGALAAILMLFKFPLPFMPPFMSFDFAGLPEIIGAFVFGPVAGFFIILIKILLKFVTMGTTSAMTGEVQNVLLSCAYVLPASLLYHRHKTRRMAMVGMLVGTVCCCGVAVLTNLYLIFPFYINLMGMSWEAIIGACSKMNPLMKDIPTMVIFGIIPFNVIKYGVTSLVTALLYKRISRPMKQFLQEDRRPAASATAAQTSQAKKGELL